jgi:hypothetical protein
VATKAEEPIENAGKMIWTLIVNPNWIRESTRARGSIGGSLSASSIYLEPIG